MRFCVVFKRKSRKKVKYNKKPRKFFNFRGLYFTILLKLQITAKSLRHQHAMNS
jgi:hypothetical protein